MTSDMINKSRVSCDVFITKSNSAQNNHGCTAERSSIVNKPLLCIIMSISKRAFVFEEGLGDKIHSVGAHHSFGSLNQRGLQPLASLRVIKWITISVSLCPSLPSRGYNSGKRCAPVSSPKWGVERSLSRKWTCIVACWP